MTDNQFVSLGSLPTDEWGVHVEAPDYQSRSEIDCIVFRRMLLRLNPVPQDVRCKLVMTSPPPRSGIDRELRAEFSDEPGARYARTLAHSLPELWDDIARAEIDWYELRSSYQHALALRLFGEGDRAFSYTDREPPPNVCEVVVEIVRLLEIPRAQPLQPRVDGRDGQLVGNWREHWARLMGRSRAY